jgi:hypothetical protein
MNRSLSVGPQHGLRETSQQALPGSTIRAGTCWGGKFFEQRYAFQHRGAYRGRVVSTPWCWRCVPAIRLTTKSSTPQHIHRHPGWPSTRSGASDARPTATSNLDPARIEQPSRRAGHVPVHLYGQACRMTEIMALAAARTTCTWWKTMPRPRARPGPAASPAASGTQTAPALPGQNRTLGDAGAITITMPAWPECG